MDYFFEGMLKNLQSGTHTVQEAMEMAGEELRQRTLTQRERDVKLEQVTMLGSTEKDSQLLQLGEQLTAMGVLLSQQQRKQKDLEERVLEQDILITTLQEENHQLKTQISSMKRQQLENSSSFNSSTSNGRHTLTLSGRLLKKQPEKTRSQEAKFISMYFSNMLDSSQNTDIGDNNNENNDSSTHHHSNNHNDNTAMNSPRRSSPPTTSQPTHTSNSHNSNHSNNTHHSNSNLTSSHHHSNHSHHHHSNSDSSNSSEHSSTSPTHSHNKLFLSSKSINHYSPRSPSSPRSPRTPSESEDSVVVSDESDSYYHKKSKAAVRKLLSSSDPEYRQSLQEGARLRSRSGSVANGVDVPSLFPPIASIVNHGRPKELTSPKAQQVH